MLEIIYQDDWLVAVNKPSAGWCIAAGSIATRKWW
ncbi:tRNA pseudouridine synthase C [Klebsiella pneumoniae]|uniref:tRNA pseudouridine synthase C n=1 Tax=Klebsiella pneumoniae TaxID=573 RepID=A0A2X3CEF9_KLEPN|nr:tRNA pseudouridine synthase C [Klebsiella pneumoniae]